MNTLKEKTGFFSLFRRYNTIDGTNAYLYHDRTPTFGLLSRFRKYNTVDNIKAYLLRDDTSTIEPSFKMDSGVLFPIWMVESIEELKKLGLIQEHNVIMFYGSVKNNKLTISNDGHVSSYHINPKNSSSDGFPHIKVSRDSRNQIRVSIDERYKQHDIFWTAPFDRFLLELGQQVTGYEFSPVNGWGNVHYFLLLTHAAKLSEDHLKLFDGYITEGASVRAIAHLYKQGISFEEMKDYVTLPLDWVTHIFPMETV